MARRGRPGRGARGEAGCVIETVNGRTIHDWTKALSLIAVNPDTDVMVKLDRQGERKTLTLRPSVATELKIGYSGLVPDMPVEVGGVIPRSGERRVGGEGVTL